MERLSYRKIFLFWAPLAATWLMMSVEGPLLAAIIARLPEPKFNLAAYGVAFAFALIIEAPVIMMMSASTALVSNRQSYFKLRNFTFFLSGAITVLMMVLIIPPVFYFIAEDLIKLPPEVARLTHLATAILLPWPGTIGYRRFYQGILIRGNLTRRVAYGTAVRLTTMAGTAFLLYWLGKLPGVAVGAIALSAGVTMEALASRIMVHRVLKGVLQKPPEPDEPPLTYRFIGHFYYPLALTSLLSLGVHPLVTFFVGQSRLALESLAVLPVINSLVFIFRSLGLSFQEVGIALMGKRMEGYRTLRNFATALGLAVVVCLGLLAFTPFAQIWFHEISGLSLELTEFALLPTRIMVLMPGLTVLLSFQRAVLVYARHTSPITLATALEVGGILLVLFLLIHYGNAVGAVAATAGFVLGRLAANLYLFPPFLQAVKQTR